jgi:hypothetical protein
MVFSLLVADGEKGRIPFRREIRFPRKAVFHHLLARKGKAIILETRRMSILEEELWKPEKEDEGLKGEGERI